ncbi:MAG: ribosome maturation factor RimM [Terracidiphilus sp.]|jgi:16S rRNA processing protein RimM
MTSPEDWVWLARIRHTQGRKGEVFADILTDFPGKFAERKRLWLLATSPAKKSIQSSTKRQGTTFPGSPSTGLRRWGGSSVVPQASQDKSRALAPAENASPREVELVAHWLHKGGIVLHFAGMDSISAAETLKGLIVAIPRSERAALGEDEVYTGDLIGCALIDVAGTEPVTVGEIESVDRTVGPVALLVVKSATGEVLIPFAKNYLRKIDLKAKRVEMALPEGLAELNAPGKTP